MPKGLSDAEEKMWAKAKAAVAQQKQKPVSDIGDGDWALVQHIFQKIKKSKQKNDSFALEEARLSAFASRFASAVALFESEKKDEYDGRQVPLEKPMKGDSKKYKVYVKNDKGNVVKVEFGDPNMEIKRDNDKRRAAFRARHGCDKNPGPKWKPKYWACKFWEKDKTVGELLS